MSSQKRRRRSFSAAGSSVASHTADTKTKGSESLWLPKTASVYHTTTRRPSEPRLVWDPIPWLKLQFLCHKGDTEVGGFAIVDKENWLRVIDFYTVRQKASVAFVDFNAEGVADFKEQCEDAGYDYDQYAKVWVHTHPGSSPTPSGVDEETFADPLWFGKMSWAVMAILAKGGATYARLRHIPPIGPIVDRVIPMETSYENLGATFYDYPDFNFRTAQEEWTNEYEANITARGFSYSGGAWATPESKSQTPATPLAASDAEHKAWKEFERSWPAVPYLQSGRQMARDGVLIPSSLQEPDLRPRSVWADFEGYGPSVGYGYETNVATSSGGFTDTEPAADHSAAPARKLSDLSDQEFAILDALGIDASADEDQAAIIARRIAWLDEDKNLDEIELADAIEDFETERLRRLRDELLINVRPAPLDRLEFRRQV
jgi:proteasome lid subunit RPN8/RPN11